jgi:phage head maturation protease
MYVIKDEWRFDDQGVPYREILEAKLTEISIVINPAYHDTEVEARGMPEEIRQAVEARTTAGNAQAQQPGFDYTLARAQVDLFKLKFGM